MAHFAKVADFPLGFGRLDIANDDGIYPGAPRSSTKPNERPPVTGSVHTSRS